MTTVEYLSQARILNKKIDIKLERYAELKSLAEKSTKVLTGMPRGGQSKVDDTIAKIVDMSNEINDEIDRLIDLEREISKVINQLEGEEEMTLELYYLGFNTWEKVAERIGYEERQIYRIHERAIAKLRLPDEDRANS